ncbi:MAG: hypothetical protein V1863_06745 [Candidatus Omnitrophota bacterium]
MFNKKSMTLVELIIAMLLVSTFLLAGVSVELAMRRINRTTDLEAILITEGETILLRISSDLQNSLGALHPSLPLESPFRTALVPQYQVRKDANHDSMPDFFDTWSGYHFHAPLHELRYFPDAANATYVVLSDHVMSFSMARLQNGTAYPCVKIDLSLVDDPLQPFPTITNPQVDFTTCVAPHAASIS